MKSRFIREQKTICGKEYMEVDLLHVSPAEHRASVRRKKAFASSLAMQNCNERYARRYGKKAIMYPTFQTLIVQRQKL